MDLKMHCSTIVGTKELSGMIAKADEMCSPSGTERGLKEDILKYPRLTKRQSKITPTSSIAIPL